MLTVSFTHVPDHVVLRQTHALIAQDRATTAQLLAHLAEIEARRLHEPAGYSSLYARCVGELKLCEQAALKRIRAARAARRFPAILEAVAKGRLHLTAVVLLAPYLTTQNAAGLLAAAEHKSRADLEVLLAERYPRPDVPTLMQPITQPVHPSGPSREAAPASTAQLSPGTVGMTLSSQPAAHQIAPHAAPVPAAPLTLPSPVPPQRPRSRVAPLSPGRYALQVTLPQATHDRLRRAQELLGHAVPAGDIAAVLDRALELLVRHLEHKRCAATERPRRRRSDAKGRHVPAAIRREVWQRDQGQCTYVSDTGHRCETKSALELDHIQPYARGGHTRASNLRLRCRAHNQLAAEQAYGAAFMIARRNGTRPQSALRVGACGDPVDGGGAGS